MNYSCSAGQSDREFENLIKWASLTKAFSEVHRWSRRIDLQEHTRAVSQRTRLLWRTVLDTCLFQLQESGLQSHAVACAEAWEFREGKLSR